jgi:hypothetical protein
MHGLSELHGADLPAGCKGLDVTDTENDPELEHIGLAGTGLHEQMEELVRAHTDDQFREAYQQRFEIHDPSLDGGRTIAGEPPLARVEMREYVSEPKQLTPEEMAEQLNTTVDQVGEVIKAQIELYTRAMGQIQQQMIPPKLNRAQRRARDKAMRRSRGR